MRLAARSSLIAALLGMVSALCLSAEPVTLRFNIDPIGKAYELNKSLCAEYEQAHPGTKIEIQAGPTDATERLALYNQYFAAKSPDTDVYQVDVIWPGILARHLVDLSEALGPDKAAFFPAIVANNTVKGKLVAVPWYADAGALYYRSDLLAKYGFAKPPGSWDELEVQAAKIQAGERAAGNANFQGLVFQAAAYEGLTCNAVEWQSAAGGGAILDADGNVTVNNAKAAAAFSRARRWVGTIAPEGVTTYREEECRGAFQGGNAAFMRNWPYAYALMESPDSPVRGKFAMTVLPSGGAMNAAALGGWQLAVSKYSTHPAEATDFVKYMTGEAAQRRRALEGGLLPSRVALYDDAALAKAIPYLVQMKSVFLSATPRPSTAAARSYNQVSTLYFQAVHSILTGERPADKALAELEGKLKAAVK